jgi:hypothetical protein
VSLLQVLRNEPHHCLTGLAKGASSMPTKDHIEWPYVTLLVGIVMMVAAAAHLLSAWVALVIFGALWVGFAIWSKR